MGHLFTKKIIELCNVISKKDLIKYPNFIVKGEIIIKNDPYLNVPEIEIRLEEYPSAIICLWPIDFELNQSFSSYSESEIVTNF